MTADPETEPDPKHCFTEPTELYANILPEYLFPETLPALYTFVNFISYVTPNKPPAHGAEIFPRL